MGSPNLLLTFEFNHIYASDNFGGTCTLVNDNRKIHDICYVGNGVLIAALRVGEVN